MSDPVAKRVFTDSVREGNMAADERELHGIPEDLDRQLRNVGARIRRSVTEGYATQRSQLLSDPASYARESRSRDDSTLFRTSNDVLLSVYSDRREMPRYADTNIHDAEARFARRPNFFDARKRPRETDAESTSSIADPVDSDIELSDPDEPKNTEATAPGALREVRPLKKRGMGVTQSLPAGSLRFGVADSSAQLDAMPEEDWKQADFNDFFNKPPQ
jgi:hypothetical protein